MLVGLVPVLNFVSTHFYTWIERGIVCLTQEHITMSPVKAQNPTAQSGMEHNNHKAAIHICPAFDSLVYSALLKLNVTKINNKNITNLSKFLHHPFSILLTKVTFDYFFEQSKKVFRISTTGTLA